MNADIVDLLLDCDNFSADTYETQALRHSDGRPFTADEHNLVAQATLVELRAVRDISALALQHHQEQEQLMQELVTLTHPYFDQLGADATIGHVRNHMTPTEAERLDHIVQRLSGLS